MFGNIAGHFGNLCLVVLAVMVTASGIPVKRSVDNTHPCSTGTGEAEVKEFEVILEDLKPATDGVKLLAQDIKQDTREFLEKAGLGDRLSSLDKLTFVDSFPANSVAEEEIEGIVDRAELLMSHWSHMFNITTLVNYARTHGVLGKSEYDDDSQEANLRNHLDQLELQIDDVVCKVYDGLRSEGISEPATPEYTIPSLFKRFQDDNYKLELYRVYILMEDVAMVTGHLNSVYKTM